MSGRFHLGDMACGVVLGSAVGVARKAGTSLKIGKGHSLKHRVLDVACAMLQRKYPLDAMSTYLNGFHFYADDMGRQVEATHFCIHLEHDFHQCVIFDKNAPDAWIIGIEYIVSAERYAQLPDEEKKLWHSHDYEVKSGLLLAPGIPELAERPYFEDLVTTYGKTFHTWQYDRDDFPYGAPQLMMGFIQDGQVDPALVEARDQRLGVSTQERRDKRSGIEQPTVDPHANPWKSGTSVQTDLRDVPFQRQSS